jgi:uncharacterized protein
VDDILNQTEHRPFEMPSLPWKYYQEWNDVVFLHWEVDVDELKTLVPKDLEIDLIEGKAWVSIVVFKMEKCRLRNLPGFTPISNFLEINVRTYVKHKGVPGVHFLSIEAGNNLSCGIAKMMSGLPYRYSKMNMKHGHVINTNKTHSDTLSFKRIVQSEIVNKSELTLWLTERYALFQDAYAAVNAFDIHHKPWPLFNVEVLDLKLNYPRFNSLFNAQPNEVHYSPGVKVLAWGKRKFLAR